MLASIIAALLLAAPDAPGLEIVPLVPPTAAAKPDAGTPPVAAQPSAPKPDAKPASPDAAAKPDAPAAAAVLPLPAQPELQPPPLPLAPPPLVKLVSETGVLVEADASALEQGLAGVVRASTRSSGGQILPRPETACDDACLYALGAARKLDRLLVATYADRSLRLRLLDVALRKELAARDRDAEPAELAAVGEMLACQLIIPLGCSGEVQLEGPAFVQLRIDQQAVQPGRQKLAVGVHELVAGANGRTARRTLAITREPNRIVYVTAAPGFSDAPPEAVALQAPEPSRGHKLRPVGYLTISAAFLAGGAGVYLGARSKNDLNSAESGFKQNGAYRTGDLSNLTSGNSAARGANALFIAAGALAVAGGVLAFAF